MNSQHIDHAQRPMPASIASRTLEFAGMRVTLRIVHEESSGACTVFESTIVPYFTGHQPHVHRQTTEVFYIIQGSLAFTLGDETVIARQGGVVHVAPGVVHRFWNPTATPVTYLVFQSPGGFEQYFFELSTLLAGEPSLPSVDISRFEALGMKYDQFPA